MNTARTIENIVPTILAALASQPVVVTNCWYAVDTKDKIADKIVTLQLKLGAPRLRLGPSVLQFSLQLFELV